MADKLLFQTAIADRAFGQVEGFARMVFGLDAPELHFNLDS